MLFLLRCLQHLHACLHLLHCGHRLLRQLLPLWVLVVAVLGLYPAGVAAAACV
jgi:hypothetical protein